MPNDPTQSDTSKYFQAIVGIRPIREPITIPDTKPELIGPGVARRMLRQVGVAQVEIEGESKFFFHLKNGDVVTYEVSGTDEGCDTCG